MHDVSFLAACKLLLLGVRIAVLGFEDSFAAADAVAADAVAAAAREPVAREVAVVWRDAALSVLFRLFDVC